MKPEWKELHGCDEIDYKQLVKDMSRNLYALYNRHSCMCHGDPREGYEFLPELLARIKKVVDDD